MASLRITLLGGFEARFASGEAVAISSRKSQALLAYLALAPGEACSRDKLMGLLWSDRGEAQARGSLRKALAGLRKALSKADPEPLKADRDNLSLDAGAVEVDAVELEHLVADGAPEALERATELYRGDLLDGIAVNDPAFEDWLRGARELLHECALKAFSGLLDHHTAIGASDAAIATARRLVALDPLQESSHRALMKLYAGQGDRAMALKQYQACREVLRAELGLQPDAETEHLIDKIRQGLSEPDEAETPASSPAAATEPLALPDGPSVAVLPFENKSGDPDQAYFADGLTENIIAGLTRFREILVIGVKSILIVREQASDLREIGRTLGVAHIVEGSVRKAADRVRVTVRLVDAATGQRLWAENYDRDLDDIFAVEDEITDIVVATLAGQIEHLELRRAAKKPAEDPVAYDCVLRGRQCLNRYTKDGELEARRHFERALELDPDYAAAYAGLSISYIHEYEDIWSDAPEEALEHAYTLAQKAVALDDADSPARYAIASACFYRGQHELAKVHIEKALELNPNDYLNICTKGWFLAFGDQSSESIACSIEAMRLNPLVPDNCLFVIGMAEYAAGRYEEALAAFGKVKGWGLLCTAWIAACYAQLGRDAQAEAAAAEVRELTPSDPSTPDKDDLKRWRAYWSRLGKFEDPNDQARFLDGLRKAGLPA